MPTMTLPLRPRCLLTLALPQLLAQQPRPLTLWSARSLKTLPIQSVVWLMLVLQSLLPVIHCVHFDVCRKRSIA